MPVSITDSQSILTVRPQAVRIRLGRILRDLKCPEKKLCLLVCGDEEIRSLNLKFRNLGQATNVLAFPSGPRFPGEKDYLGDLVISAETVIREAQEAGRPAGEVFYFYLVHGLLHLLGYDHTLGEEEDLAQTEETSRLLNLIRLNL
jgi:probable rRNA maturation factor